MKDTLILWRDALTLYTTGQYKEVIAKYEQIGELSARMLYNLACVHVKTGDVEQAIQVSHLVLGFVL